MATTYLRRHFDAVTGALGRSDMPLPRGTLQHVAAQTSSASPPVQIRLFLFDGSVDPDFSSKLVSGTAGNLEAVGKDVSISISRKTAAPQLRCEVRNDTGSTIEIEYHAVVED